MKATTVLKIFIICFLSITHVMAVDPPQGFTFQGRLTGDDGGPVESVVNITFEIMDPAGTCLLYKQTYSSIDLSAASIPGSFSLEIGSKVGSIKRASPDPNLSMSTIFSNQGTITGASSCTYNPLTGDGRMLKISIDDAGDVTVLTQTIRTVPNAIVAQTVQGISPSSLIQDDGTVTQAKVNQLSDKYAELLDLVATAPILKAPTSDGNDNSYSIIAGGGAGSSSRGAMMGLNGNEHTTGGLLSFTAGYDASSTTGSTQEGGIKFVAGGTATRMFISRDGNVGIGNDAPTNKLHIGDGSVGTETLAIEATGGNGILSFNSTSDRMELGTTTADDISILTENSEKVKIKSSGMVGIGSSDPRATLDVNGDIVVANSGGYKIIDSANSIRPILFIDGNNDIHLQSHYVFGDLIFDAGGATEHMRITRLGNVGIGTDTPGYLLHVDGTAGKPGGGSWTDSSDRRLKKNIENMNSDEALEKITQLQGVFYRWANPEIHQEGVQAGLIAQEVQEIFPDWVGITIPYGLDKELVDNDESLNLQFPFSYNAYIIEAIKELKSRNSKLSLKIEHLERQNYLLKNKLNVIEAAIKDIKEKNIVPQ